MQCQVINRFFNAMSAIAEAERVPRDYGTGHMLYRSETSFLEMISWKPDLNAIELSEALSVTRGAITQMGTKLEEKGFIERYSRPGNKKEKYYRLTSLGDEFIEKHRLYHAAANTEMCEYLCSIGDDNKEVIIEFLEKVARSAPISIYECNNHYHG